MPKIPKERESYRFPITPDADGSMRGKGAHQFGSNEARQGDGLLGRGAALNAPHNEQRVPGWHRLHRALEPSRRHRTTNRDPAAPKPTPLPAPPKGFLRKQTKTLAKTCAQTQRGGVANPTV